MKQFVECFKEELQSLVSDEFYFTMDALDIYIYVNTEHVLGEITSSCEDKLGALRRLGTITFLDDHIRLLSSTFDGGVADIDFSIPYVDPACTSENIVTFWFFVWEMCKEKYGWTLKK